MLPWNFMEELSGKVNPCTEKYSYLSDFKTAGRGIPPFTQTFIICYLFNILYSLEAFFHTLRCDGSSGRRPLRFVWVVAKLAVRRISLLPSAKISHCVSNISHAFAYITRVGSSETRRQANITFAISKNITLRQQYITRICVYHSCG